MSGRNSFDVEAYLRELAACVDGPLGSGMAELRADLLKHAGAKGQTADYQAKLDLALDRLKQRTRANFEKNMTKFILYAVRNIFTPPSSSTASDSSLSHVLEQKDSELVELETRWTTMQTRYQQTQAEYLDLSNKCKDMDHLIRDMRNALFTLRVASQSFEDVGAHNLEDVTMTIQQYKQKLQECTDQAHAYLIRLDEDETSTAGSAAPAAEDSKHEQEDAEDAAATIQSSSAGSVQKLVQSITGK